VRGLLVSAFAHTPLPVPPQKRGKLEKDREKRKQGGPKLAKPFKTLEMGWRRVGTPRLAVRYVMDDGRAKTRAQLEG